MWGDEPPHTKEWLVLRREKTSSAYHSTNVETRDTKTKPVFSLSMNQAYHASSELRGVPLEPRILTLVLSFPTPECGIAYVSPGSLPRRPEPSPSLPHRCTGICTAAGPRFRLTLSCVMRTVGVSTPSLDRESEMAPDSGARGISTPCSSFPSPGVGGEEARPVFPQDP